MTKGGNMTRKYESMVIISSKLTEENAKKENEKILGFIKNNGGMIIKTDEWGKRKLSYEIQKSREGYYFVNYFELDAQFIKKMEQFYRIEESIVRFNILN
jgi:small subunit ribosomal protein S6